MNSSQPSASGESVPPEVDPVMLHWPSPGLKTTTVCQGEPLPAAAFAPSEAAITCPACRDLLDDTVLTAAWTAARHGEPA